MERFEKFTTFSICFFSSIIYLTLPKIGIPPSKSTWNTPCQEATFQKQPVSKHQFKFSRKKLSVPFDFLLNVKCLPSEKLTVVWRKYNQLIYILVNISCSKDDEKRNNDKDG